MEKLALRKAIKAKQPRFKRQDSHKRVKVKKGWRRPKGYQSKMRTNIRGYARKAQIGFGSPAEVRGLHSSGLKPVVVATLAELEKLDAKTQGAVLCAGLGGRKREALITAAASKNIILLNLKDSAAELKKLKDEVAARKQERDTKQALKAKKKEKKDLEQRAKEASEKSDEEHDGVATPDAPTAEEVLAAEKQKVLTSKKQ